MTETKRVFETYDKGKIDELAEIAAAAEQRFNEEFRVLPKGRKKRITKDILREVEELGSKHKVTKEQLRNFRKTGI